MPPLQRPILSPHRASDPSLVGRGVPAARRGVPVRFSRCLASGFWLACALTAGLLLPNASAAPLGHEAYVWQRAWGEPVRTALRQHGSAFNRVVALRAEISWKNRQPQVVHVPLDYAALRQCGSPVGLALRIGAYPGAFSAEDSTGKLLVSLAGSIVREARTNGLEICELQLDFDCAESKLDGYRVWMTAVRSAIAPVPLTITALPSWLDQADFKKLVAVSDGFVLQVHSLERPRDSRSPFTLCDPTAARRAVARAAALGRAFSVALPTYGYLVAFDPKGKFVGLSAEGPARSWPPETLIREVHSDPRQVASLVQFWATNRPANLRSVIWYRLPVSDDVLNWRWPTLGAIIALRSPRESTRTESRRVETGLTEISLVNDGELDISSRLAVEVRWSTGQGTRLIAADGLRGFQVVEQTASTLQLESEHARLPAGEKQVIGWLRFNTDREVQVECKKF